ncbi:hypothetical protein AS850_14055 [Frondihabitans sp. 762G35]|uniref:CBM35 domain-containing protein n=1 Tax=Frondihabitans sp. 762G35 TaxID=1446794 RepID=UPI000D200C33|nr:CBM35 domain-containing protein [Frondihabitans sp. 762G35]ARC58204.1 hypothetical protein AS850_14055 [Frondihabitans sp. 762G35]
MIFAHHHRARRFGAGILGVALVAGLSVVAAPPAQAATDAVSVNFASSTGSYHGGAAGALYGLSDDGVTPSAVTAGANPVTLSQKDPGGAQHPNGDALKVSNEFFSTGGKYLFIYTQDTYPDFPYNGGARPTDFSTYVTAVTDAVKAVKATDPNHFAQYVFLPFNEPEQEWYGNYSAANSQRLVSDWATVYAAIKGVDSRALVGGPAFANYQHGFESDLLTYGKAHGSLPDFTLWHELNRGSLANYAGNYADYRALETSVGVSPIPININEWGDRSDLSVPGQMIQWLAMFEKTKVYADTAYWSYAGNLNDNSAGPNSANGGWWMEKWYADLSGNTVAVTPPQANTPQTVQGIATVDAGKKQATVLLGGNGNAVSVSLAGLDQSVFGTTVDVTVARDTWSGYEGSALQPKPFQTQRLSLTNGTPSITIPNSDRMSAYRIIVTPAATTAPAVDTTWSTSVEAENTTLTDVTAYAQDTDADPMTFATSNKKDVGDLSHVDSALTWNVTVPATGTYRLGIYDGTQAAPGQNALFVDNGFSQIVQYTADLSYTYRNRTDVLVNLAAGTHALSIRTSRDGSTLLPGSNLAIDKFDLTQVVGAESASYPARFGRVAGTTPFVSGQGRNGALVSVTGSASDTFFIAAGDDGYYDLALDYRTPNAAATLAVTVNGRPLSGFASTSAGGWTSTARVHLAAGISQVQVSAASGTAQLDTLRTVRATGGDSSTKTIEAESGTISGASRVSTLAAGTNASGGKAVTYVGNGSGNTLTIARPTGTPAGLYDLGVHYANAEQNTANHYNTDVVSRTMTIAENGGATTQGIFRHNYSYASFWWKTVPLQLTTANGALVLGNPSSYAPDLDQVTLSPLQLSSSTSTYTG